ncbi:MAG TPA: DinB family protein [Chitinophagaceae bacterium]|nr:DinB family protein [Chitinophagaceae bacterium]
MKELFNQLAAYHLWANQLLLSSISSLPEEMHTKQVDASFPSLLKTVQHMWDAEFIWWQRMKLQERITAPSQNFTGGMAEVIRELIQQNKQWSQWVGAAQEHQLEHVFQYQNTKREQFKQPIYQMLLHLFNHGTYHRGQLVNILRQLGVEKIPATDFIVWSRRKL